MALHEYYGATPSRFLEHGMNKSELFEAYKRNRGHGRPWGPSSAYNAYRGAVAELKLEELGILDRAERLVDGLGATSRTNTGAWTLRDGGLTVVATLHYDYESQVPNHVFGRFTDKWSPNVYDMYHGKEGDNRHRYIEPEFDWRDNMPHYHGSRHQKYLAARAIWMGQVRSMKRLAKNDISIHHCYLVVSVVHSKTGHELAKECVYGLVWDDEESCATDAALYVAETLVDLAAEAEVAATHTIRSLVEDRDNLLPRTA
jgi:hypothetical protein